jgi:hypothetical protein
MTRPHLAPLARPRSPLRPSATSLAAGLALASVMSLWPAQAAANGRFPAANQLVKLPDDASRLFIRTTFGLLSSHDGGASFEWLCESQAGYSGSQDPAVMMVGDGAFVVALFDGLATSLDGGCSFERAPALEGQYVIDVALDKQKPSSAVALTSSGLDNDKFYNQVFETSDGGKSWGKVGVPAPDDLLSETIEPAPSRPERIYVSGFYVVKDGTSSVRHGVVEVSDDRGKSWARTEVDLAGDTSVFIAAVDPTDADRVYARTTGITQDRLMLSIDGGKSFSPVLTVEGSMLGFALSPDGKQIAAGGPAAGVLVAQRDSLAFEKKADKIVACLTWAPEGLYACGNGAKDGYVIGLSKDEGASFSPLLAGLQDLKGPLGSCPDASAFHMNCDGEWNTLKGTLGVGSVGGSGGAGGATAGGLGGSGGTAAGGEQAAGASGQGAGEPPAAGDDGKTCGCRAPGRASATWLPASLGILAALAALSRFRNRRASHVHGVPHEGEANSPSHKPR